MAKVRVDISEDLPDVVKKYVQDNEETVAKEIESRAVSSTAFKDETGKLRGSIKALKSKFPDGGWIVRAGAPHAWVVEHGHKLWDWRTGKFIKQVPAKSYLRTAKEATIESAKRIFGVK